MRGFSPTITPEGVKAFSDMSGLSLKNAHIVLEAQQRRKYRDCLIVKLAAQITDDNRDLMEAVVHLLESNA